ncbi:MAG: carbohydrate ABC transporter permease [Anaerobacillus sp.]|uniref:carbohydrate ABC transporter permease n=1 Tax=Anaerobacillus sp. TaxID=1872506 RepID=UPI00391AEF67
MKLKIVKFSLNIVVIIIALLCLYPFIIMVIGSLKTAAELSSNPAGIPLRPTIENYIRLLTHSGGLVARTFFNAIFISVTHVVLTLAVSSLAAFAFAKYTFRGKNIMFVILLATMMVPFELAIPPLYVMLSRIGWLNTYSVQIFPGIASVFAMFLLRQFMMKIPDDLIDAAKIDGAGHIRTFLSVIVPTSAPVLGALAVLIFLGKWNDFLWPVIMVRDTAKLPIMLILPLLSDTDQTYSLPWELILAGCTLVTVPLVLVFLKFQKKFMSSVTIGAVKE